MAGGTGATVAVHTAFEGIAFDDPAAAEAELNVLLEGGNDNLADNLRMGLEETASPDRALIRLGRFLAACDSPQPHQERMARELEYTRLLCTLFDQSHFLTDIVCANPEHIDWLWLASDRHPRWRSQDLQTEVRGLVDSAATFDACCRSLRQCYRREILRIGVRDLINHDSVEDVTADLTCLAEAMLEGALTIAQREAVGRYGSPLQEDAAEATFVVIGMGKLGGRELNFSSDIDLIFIYSEDGTTKGTGAEAGSGGVSNAEYFHKVGELLIEAITAQTSDGHIFRVDMRLRPHGRMSPLASSLDSTLIYFEMQGDPWERQALIKARPVAGDRKLGDTFIAQTRPLVFPRYFDDQTLEDIRDTKGLAEAEVARQGRTENEVKLGRGGIRDIEFTVQMLQLLNGGRNPGLRSTNTLETLTALGEQGLLSAFDALALARNYAYYRQIEHRLQIEGSRQRHALPDDPKELDDFARRLGYESGPAFMVGYRERTEETRKVLERFFATEGSGNLWIAELLTPQGDGVEGIERLQSMGFKDGARARRELMGLHAGPGDLPYPARARQQFRTLAPSLLQALSSIANPDDALMRVGRMLTGLRAPSALYDILVSNPEMNEILVTLVSNSLYLTDFIVRDPGLFETFGYSGALDRESTIQTLRDQLELLQRAFDSNVALYRLRDSETLRVGLGELLGKRGIAEVGRDLTLLADICVQETLEEAHSKTAERFGPTTIPFAVVGMGKMGGGEMGYGSDLDLVFVYGTEGSIESGTAPSEYFAGVAAHLIKLLKEPTRYGMLYDIDARLRPDGQKGVLAVSVARFEEYYRNEAQAWERMALVKARAVAGEPSFCKKIERIALEGAYSSPLSREDLENVEDIRKRLVEKASPRDLKKGEGGIAEIEFVARLLQIRHGAANSTLQRRDAIGALSELEDASILSPADGQILREAYRFLRRIENRIRMYEGRAGSLIPETPEAQKDLALRLAVKGELAQAIDEHRSSVHQVYRKIYNELLRRDSGT